MFTIPYKPVSVPKGGFIFCKYGVAVLLWAAFIWRLEWAVIAGAAILALNALLTVKWAPLIVLYAWTVEKLRPSRVEMLDEYGMRFAHTLGTLLLGTVLLLLHIGREHTAWTFLLGVCIAKTIGALGFCAASCMYRSLFNSGAACCAFSGKTPDESSR